MQDDVRPALGPTFNEDAASEGGTTRPRPLSKRAARRLIQRAVVLVGRDRHVRQQTREARLVTLWVIEDWGLAWTVVLDRGKIHFERRPAKHPAVTLSWQTAEHFLHEIESGKEREFGHESLENPASRRLLSPVLRAFCLHLRQLLREPVDDYGEPIN